MKRSIKKVLLTGAAVMVLGGCQVGANIAEKREQLGLIVDFVVTRATAKPVDRAAVIANPYASLGFRYGDSPQSMISLVQTQGEKQFWSSSDGLIIVTQDGRIVRTSGFPDNLSGSKAGNQDPLALPHRPGWAGSPFRRTLDFKTDFGFGHPATCQLQANGTEEITVLGVSIMTEIFVENCDVPSLGWSFENTHWMDAKTGFLWRSQQWVSPNQKRAIELEVLRPSAEDRSWQIHSALNSVY